MKTTCMLSLPFVFSAAVVAQADTSVVSIPNLTFAHRTNLIDIDQSQTFETLSVADEFTRLPVSSYLTAGVYFISKDKEQVFGSAGGNNTFEDPTIKQCIGDGYKYNASNCSGGLPADTCPYNTGYFKTCCDVAYNYTEENCSLLNKSSSCGNKYKCDCSEEKYPVMANSCTSPQIPTTESGASCTVNGQIRYTKCICPTGVNASYGCDTYYASPCNSVCKKAKSDNCDNRTAVQTPYGCEKYYADCASKCEKAYTDNCRNRIAVSAPNGCESYYADCSSKCEVAKTAPADNCANRTAVSAPYGCEKYYADCSSKCEKAYTDNCHNRTAVSTPNGCKSYYSDCSYKCEIAEADNCDNRTAVIDACPLYVKCTYFSDCSSKIESYQLYNPLLYGDGTVSDKYPLLSREKPIGIVFDEKNHLAIAPMNINEDGSVAKKASTAIVKWSNNKNGVPEELESCDMPDNYTVEVTCGIDGRANTDKILACGEACGGTPAATACNIYEPEGCSADFCRAGKWFLPSMRDLSVLNLSLESTTLNLLESEGIMAKKGYASHLWSSNVKKYEYSDTKNAWYFNLGTAHVAHLLPTSTDSQSSVAVRPVIKYP